MEKTVFMWMGKTYPFWKCLAGPLHCTTYTHSLLDLSVCFLQRFDEVSDMTIHCQVFYIISSVLIQETSLVIFYITILLCMMAEEVRYWLWYQSQKSYLNFTCRLHWDVFFGIAYCFSFSELCRINDSFLHVVVAAHMVLITEYQVLFLMFYSTSNTITSD